MRWVLLFDSVLSASVAEVGPVAMRCVGSVEMRHVPGFDFVVSVSVSSVDSVVMGWMEVIGSAVSGSMAGVGMGWMEDIGLVVIWKEPSGQCNPISLSMLSMTVGSSGLQMSNKLSTIGLVDPTNLDFFKFE